MTVKAQHLRPGEWVEVLAAEEILATLDRGGADDGLPFMPEMLQYCGRRFQVYRRADKTCDTIDNSGSLRLQNTVHLSGLRCDGSAHGGCEAGCLMFWREGWLRRIGPRESAERTRVVVADSPTSESRCTLEGLSRAAVVDEHERIFRCQITELKSFSVPLPWWDVRQYARDVFTNGVRIRELLAGATYAFYRRLTEIGFGYRLLVGIYDFVQKLRSRPPFPLRSGSCTKTPTALLDLRPGELVRVKSYPEILATLDGNNKNRGLWFDAEMVQYCGKTYRVAKRVRRILHEKSGRMLEFSNPCIVLQDVFCRARHTKYRLFCPRSILTYWREIWLERV